MHLRNAQNPKLTTSSTILLSLILLPSIAVRVLAQPNGLWSDSGGSSSSSGSFLQDYINCLNQSGYTSFSNALVQANHTESGQKWLAKIVPQVQSNGGAVGAPWTVFAPNDEAFASVPDSITQNATLLSELLSYHFVYGNLQNTTASAGGGSGGGHGEAGGSQWGGTSSSLSGFPTSTTSSEFVQPSLPSTSRSSTGPGGLVITSPSPSEPAGTTSAPSGSTPLASVLSERELVGQHPKRRRQEGLESLDSGWASDCGDQLLSGIYPNVTTGRTLLSDSSLVRLEGNKTQVLAWTRYGEDGNVTVLNQPTNVTVVNGFQWRNFLIAEIDAVLLPPGNLTTALIAANDTPLVSFGSQIQVPSDNGTSVTAVEFLQDATGFTLFAPDTGSFTADVDQAIQRLQGNQTALFAVLKNHYINGSTVYSPTLMQLGVDSSSSASSNNMNNTATTFYSAAGEPFTLTYNSTGLFVSHARSNSSIPAARVTRSDILVDNGVVHLIDRVLFDTQENSTAASSAYGSATSAAAQTMTDAAAIGTSPIPAPTTGTTSSTSGGSGSATTPSSFRIRRGLKLPVFIF